MSLSVSGLIRSERSGAWKSLQKDEYTAVQSPEFEPCKLFNEHIPRSKGMSVRVLERPLFDASALCNVGMVT